MDRFFLSEWVREVAPILIGSRARDVSRWGPAGFAIGFGARLSGELVVSLSPEAPGLFIGRPPLPFGSTRPPLRFTKLLTGSELVGCRAEALDRVLRLDWRRVRPSGARFQFEVVVEWVATRSAAYLIEPGSREVLDLISFSTPRRRVGETFEKLPPPPGVSPLAVSARDFVERLDELHPDGRRDVEAVKIAGGLSPGLAEAVWMLHLEGRMDLSEAFDVVRSKLRYEPSPVLLGPPGGVQDARGRYRLSPVSLPQRAGVERRFQSFNEAACAFVTEATRLTEARRRYQQLRTALGRRLKKARRLLLRAEEERRACTEPARLRRWGEILLAGLHQAVPVEGGAVEVPDPYDPEGRTVRLPIDPRRDVAGNAERYFQEARKAGKRIKETEDRMRRLADEILYLETLEVAVEEVQGTEALDALSTEMEETGIVSPRSPAAGKKKRPEKPLGPRRFPGSGGAVILAGRSARSNEELTFDIARPDELWFHAAGVAGAHVVLREPTGGEPSSEQIEEAAAVAAYYSKSRASAAVEVAYTPRRNVRKIPGAPPGTVRLSRFRSVRVRPGLPMDGDR